MGCSIRDMGPTKFAAFHQDLHCLLVKGKTNPQGHNLEIPTCDPLKYIMDKSILFAFICMGKSIRIQRVKLADLTLVLLYPDLSFFK